MGGQIKRSRAVDMIDDTGLLLVTAARRGGSERGATAEKSRPR